MWKNKGEHRVLWDLDQPRDLVKIQPTYSLPSGLHATAANYSTHPSKSLEWHCYSVFALTGLIERLLFK